MEPGRRLHYLRAMDNTRPIGDHLREWRQRRRLSQLDLALEAEISTRHLSFVETGRAQPSREMVLRLAERLDVPLRERNVLLVAAGYAPVFPSGAGGPGAAVARARPSIWCSRGMSPIRRSRSTGTGRWSRTMPRCRRCSPAADAVAAAAAGQRAAAEPASEGARAAHRQPRRMARASARRGCASRSTSPPIPC